VPAKNVPFVSDTGVTELFVQEVIKSTAKLLRLNSSCLNFMGLVAEMLMANSQS